MLSKEDIKGYLQSNPYWEPDEEATNEEWELFDEVSDELKKGKKNTDTDSEDEDEDDDSSWPEDDDY